METSTQRKGSPQPHIQLSIEEGEHTAPSWASAAGKHTSPSRARLWFNSVRTRAESSSSITRGPLRTYLLRVTRFYSPMRAEIEFASGTQNIAKPPECAYFLLYGVADAPMASQVWRSNANVQSSLVNEAWADESTAHRDSMATSYVTVPPSPLPPTTSILTLVACKTSYTRQLGQFSAVTVKLRGT